MNTTEDLSRENVESETKQVLGEMLRLDPEDIDTSDVLGEDLEFDSMDAVDLVVDLKTQIGVKFGKEDIKQVKTVGDIIEIVCEKIQGGATGSA